MKEAPGHPVDGGRRAWLTVFGSWWALFITFGWINSLGVLQAYYEQNILQEYSPSTISWIASVQQCLIYSGGIFLGRIFDGYGPQGLLIFGGFAQVFGLMMTSISTQYYQLFLAQAICSALGASAIIYGTLGSLATWWKVRRAAAYGIVTSGSSIGGVIFPIMINRLIPQVGFGWTMRAVAFIILLGSVLAAATIQSNRAHAPTPIDLRTYVSSLKEPPFALLCTGMTLMGFGVFIPFNFIPSAAQALGMSSSLSIYTVAILNAVSVFGRILPGFLADQFGRFNMMVVCSTFSAILAFALWLPGHNNAATICFAAFFGFFSGSYVSLTPALVVDISPPAEIGHRTGVLYCFISIGVLLGSPIGGALIRTDGNQYTYLKIFAGATMAGGSVLIAYTSYFVARTKAKAKANLEEGKPEPAVPQAAQESGAVHVSAGTREETITRMSH